MTDGTPTNPRERGNAWGHRLRAKKGNFGKLVWECINCNRTRTRKQFYRKADCE